MVFYFRRISLWCSWNNKKVSIMRRREQYTHNNYVSKCTCIHIIVVFMSMWHPLWQYNSEPYSQSFRFFFCFHGENLLAWTQRTILLISMLVKIIYDRMNEWNKKIGEKLRWFRSTDDFFFIIGLKVFWSICQFN